MQYERILSYNMAQKLSDEELSQVAAARKSEPTMDRTVDPHGQSDYSIDF